MITPTIGRKIWFWPNQTNMFSCSVLDATQAFDATIVFVHGANRINIQTVDHVGTTYVLILPTIAFIYAVRKHLFAMWGISNR